MKTIIILFVLFFFTSCITTTKSIVTNKRQTDRDFFIECVKDLFNQGFREDGAVNACKEAMKRQD